MTASHDDSSTLVVWRVRRTTSSSCNGRALVGSGETTELDSALPFGPRGDGGP